MALAVVWRCSEAATRLHDARIQQRLLETSLAEAETCKTTGCPRTRGPVTQRPQCYGCLRGALAA